MLNAILTTLLTHLIATNAAVTQSTLTELTRFAKFSSGAYQPICPRPLGNTLVDTVRIWGSSGILKSMALIDSN